MDLYPKSKFADLHDGIMLSVLGPFICRFHKRVHEKNLFFQKSRYRYIYTYTYAIFKTIKRVVVFRKAKSMSVYERVDYNKSMCFR